MKLSNSIKSLLQKNDFDLEFESNMVQSRFLSSIIEVVEDKNITQAELSEKTGLKQPFISALFNLHKNLNMNHIALFQKALDIKLQPPTYFSEDKHSEMFYSDKEYIPATTHFIDSEVFKGSPFVSWIGDKQIKKSINDAYSVVETISLNDLKKNKDTSFEFLEIEDSFR
ncbi:helix-turn-helix domain-containing protein [Psychroflexus gondwanensis]|jgi:predicted XRE-type DNA-binding protein|uniref:helix-turn-helix domain-containing protein n=1 Tax=Psychroflexus gondwanensis TaxID=251 RepID=UPI001680F343|nr:helix-turn-helix transcriptional regulator [Psychroflexus gondwanensis]